MSCFIEILKCILCCEEDGFEERQYGRYEAVSRRSYSPPCSFEQRLPATRSIEQSSSTVRDYGYRNETSVISARESRPGQPEITPKPSPPVLHKCVVDSYHASVSVPFPKLSSSSCSELAKKPISHYGSDLPKSATGTSGLDPPKKHAASSSPDVSKKPTAPSFPDGLKKSTAPSVLDPPRTPSSPSVSDLSKKTSASSVPTNWRSKNVIPVYSNPPDIKRIIEKDEVPDSDLPKNAIGTSCLDPPKKHAASYSPDVSKKPTAPSFPDVFKKPSAPSVLAPPRTPSSPAASDSSKITSASCVRANWRSTNVIPVYSIPPDIKRIIEKDEVPEVLKKPLSPSTYADHFGALLYAEDYYMEKWSEFIRNFVVSKVTLRLREEATSGNSRKSKKAMYLDQNDRTESNKAEKKIYVEFEVDSFPEKRPYLLSKDYVYVRRSGKKAKPFQGFLFRVEKSSLLLAEFGKDFLSQHSSAYEYDVWFNFNRVCLKRSHQGVAAAVDPSFRGILFPNVVSRSRCQIPTSASPLRNNLDQTEVSTVYHILSLKGPPPYIIVEGSSGRIWDVISEAILQIYKTFKDSRILIVAPKNRTCDSLMSGLKKEIPDSEMFRANAAFREYLDVPEDILSSSLYERESFTCPPPEDLRKFKVISSTFISSFRLHCYGIYAGHFSHIFVVDACDVTEPETMVTLANLADESTVVVLTGAYHRFTRWVRSDIARANGLKRSYFRRLLESKPYSSRDPGFVKYL